MRPVCREVPRMPSRASMSRTQGLAFSLACSNMCEPSAHLHPVLTCSSTRQWYGHCLAMQLALLPQKLFWSFYSSSRTLSRQAWLARWAVPCVLALAWREACVQGSSSHAFAGWHVSHARPSLCVGFLKHVRTLHISSPNSNMLLSSRMVQPLPFCESYAFLSCREREKKYDIAKLTIRHTKIIIDKNNICTKATLFTRTLSNYAIILMMYKIHQFNSFGSRTKNITDAQKLPFFYQLWF